MSDRTSRQWWSADEAHDRGMLSPAHGPCRSDNRWPHSPLRMEASMTATAEELAVARRSVALQQSLGVYVRLLTPAETAELCPYLATHDLLGATYSPRDGYADPYLCATAIAARARDLGFTIK